MALWEADRYWEITWKLNLRSVCSISWDGRITLFFTLITVGTAWVALICCLFLSMLVLFSSRGQASQVWYPRVVCKVIYFVRVLLCTEVREDKLSINYSHFMKVWLLQLLKHSVPFQLPLGNYSSTVSSTSISLIQVLDEEKRSMIPFGKAFYQKILLYLDSFPQFS